MKNIKVFEDYTSANEGHNKHDNYMFFQNLNTIKDAVDDILAMDKDKVDAMLSAGHGWALDHMATSVDDVEEVYHFLKNRMGDEEMVQPEAEMTRVEIIEEPGSAEMESDDEEGEED